MCTDVEETSPSPHTPALCATPLQRGSWARAASGSPLGEGCPKGVVCGLMHSPVGRLWSPTGATPSGCDGVLDLIMSTVKYPG